MKVDKILAHIAKVHLDLDTLESRNNSSDFKEQGCASIHAALHAAFVAGQRVTAKMLQVPTINRRYYVTKRNDTHVVECWEKCDGKGLFESFGHPGINVRIVACGLNRTRADNLKRILEREVTLTLMDNFNIDDENDTRINCPIPRNLPKA